MSLEYRTKLSEAHLGQIPWNKGKRYSSVSTREASTCVTRNGFRAQDWKRLVLERDEYTCQECGRTDIDKLHAHHIVPFDENVELRFSLDNGKTLCTTCHNKIHGFREGLPGYWTGKKRSPETIAKMVKGKIGVPLSEEHKQKLKGRTPWNKGTKGKTTAWNKGISPSLESRVRMGAAQKERFKTEVAWNKGKKATLESRAKMSAAHKKRFKKTEELE